MFSLNCYPTAIINSRYSFRQIFALNIPVVLDGVSCFAYYALRWSSVVLKINVQGR